MFSCDDLANILNNCTLNDKSIVYCRSSTNSQNNLNHCSIDTQIFNIRQYCTNNNLKIVNMSTEVCSATKTKNQIALLDLIKNYNSINIVVYDASRFSRNLSDGLNLLHECLNKNIIIHSVKDKCNTGTIQGYYSFVDGIKNAELESKLIGERIKSSINYRKSLGFDFGNPPYGYSKDRINGIIKFIKNDNETNVIDFARSLYYGCTMAEANKKMTIITGSKIKSLFIEPCNKIEYGNFTFGMIADFFNENNIKNKNRNWTSKSISTIVTTDYVCNKRKSNIDYSDNKKSKNITV